MTSSKHCTSNSRIASIFRTWTSVLINSTGFQLMHSSSCCLCWTNCNLIVIEEARCTGQLHFWCSEKHRWLFCAKKTHRSWAEWNLTSVESKQCGIYKAVWNPSSVLIHTALDWSLKSDWSKQCPCHGSGGNTQACKPLLMKATLSLSICSMTFLLNWITGIWQIS